MEVIFALIILGLLAGGIANDKGRNFFGWFIYGFFLSAIAIIHAILLEPSDEAKLKDGTMKQCPHCSEIIRLTAKVCHYCQRDLPEIKKLKL